MPDIVIATRNRHKFRELAVLLAVPGVCWKSLEEFPGAPSVSEGGRTFDENAARKARAAARSTGCLALADDSGLEVEALEWAPGIRSARFAGRHGDDQANTEKLLRLLEGIPSARRHARYRCSLALADPRRGVLAVTRGTWRGAIARAPRGRAGFGYDPVFLVPRLKKTVGQLPAATKRHLSHRARAARRMRPTLRRLARLRAITAPRRTAGGAGRPGRGRTA